jgi:metallophosphoesterase superfamily enzyme
VNDSIWTPDADALLKQFRGEGSTYDAIAALLTDELRVTVTSGAVRGRLRRIGLAGPPPRERALTPVSPDTGEPFPAAIPASRFLRMKLDVKEGDRWIVLNDTQFPFHDVPTLTAVTRFMDDWEPHVIVLNGDIFDFYEMSTFDQNPERGFRLQDEIDIGRRVIDRWAARHDRAKRILLCGNHEDRIRRQIWKNPRFAGIRGLELQALLSPDESWEVIPYGSQVQISHMLIEHGDKATAKAGYSAWGMFMKRGMSGIMGHTHRAAKIERRDERAEHRLFYIENGCLCSLNPEYGPLPDWQHAFTYGIIGRGGSVHSSLVDVLEDGFHEQGRWYRKGGS